MRFRSTLFYLLAAVLLVAFYFYESGKEEKEKSAKEEARILFPLKPEELQHLTLMREKDAIRLEKAGAERDWLILTPIQAPVDQMTLSRLQRILTGLKYERLISEGGGDLSEFGLENPSLVVSFGGGDREESIVFGGPSPLGASVYASVGKAKKVYLISALAKQELDKSLYDLRDKKLLSLEMDKINRVVIERGEGRWQLSKSEGRWQMDGDAAFEVDQEKVEAFVRPIIWADALSFEEEEADDIGVYGLHNPSARVILSADTRTEEVIFGDPVKDRGDGSLYAKVKGKPQVVTVRKRLLDAIPAEKEKIREGAETKQAG